jgi:hypothetical protein
VVEHAAHATQKSAASEMSHRFPGDAIRPGQRAATGPRPIAPSTVVVSGASESIPSPRYPWAEAWSASQYMSS